MQWNSLGFQYANDTRVLDLLDAFHNDCQLTLEEEQWLEDLEASGAHRKPLIVVEGTDRDSEYRKQTVSAESVHCFKPSLVKKLKTLV